MRKKDNTLKIINVIIIGFAVLIVCSFIPDTDVSAAVSNYYVSVSGDDSNIGSVNKPFRTVKKALTKVKAGGTIYIKEGTYHEQVKISKSGVNKKYITLRNYKKDKVVFSGRNIKSADSEGNLSILSIYNGSYIKLTGLRFENLSVDDDKAAVGIAVYGSGRNIDIDNCKVSKIETLREDGNAHGICVYGTSGKHPYKYIKINKCEIKNCKLGFSESLVLNGNISGFVINRNKIHDNDNIGIDMIGYEKTASKNDRVRNGTCAANKVYNIKSASNPAYEGDSSAPGIYVDGGKNITITRNNISNCDIGVSASSENKKRYSENIRIRNNMVNGCKGYAGIVIGGYDKQRGGSKGVEIYNNNIIGSEIGVAVQDYTDYSSNKIVNNILFKNKIAIESYGDIKNIKISHNDFYRNISLEKQYMKGNYTKSPSFINRKKHDFRLKKGSYLINRGRKINAGKYDYRGKSRIRHGRIDIGAIEYK